jgi:hypothetical protein
MSTRAHLVLSSALRVLKPLVRLLLRHGVSYPALAAALKPVFVDAAREELSGRGMAVTDSALTLLSGVHRRDVRRLSSSPTSSPISGLAADDPSVSRSGEPRDALAPAERVAGPLSLAAEVAGRWLTDPAWTDEGGRPRGLPRSGPASFDALVDSVSRDVRPKAVLDEMLRLGVVRVQDAQVELAEDGFVPRAAFREMAALFQSNLHDHLAASVANLEQAVFVDELTAESVHALHVAARAAWQDALREVLRVARERYEHDAAHAQAGLRVHRARFGVYFFNEAAAAPGAEPPTAGEPVPLDPPTRFPKESRDAS